MKKSLLPKDPVAFWTKVATGYREYAATCPETTKTLLEALASECEAKAAEAAAARAF